MSGKSGPPQIAPKPGSVKVVRAIYPYEAQQADELSFSEGDVLYITEYSPQSDTNGIGWWKGRCGNKTGLIPSNYVELKSEEVHNPLHDASRRGNLSFLKECLESGVSPTGLDASANSPLHWAARGGHIECLQILLHASIAQHNNPLKFINQRNKLGDTPLHIASERGHFEICKILIENGGDVRVLNLENKKPIELAHDPAIKTLLIQSELEKNCANEDDGEYLKMSDDEEDE